MDVISYARSDQSWSILVQGATWLYLILCVLNILGDIKVYLYFATATARLT